MYWCAADIGWVTGHSYIVYGPLCELRDQRDVRGYAGFPRQGPLWAIVERYKVTILYTAPTAIRTFMKWGEQYPQKHDLTSLRLLGIRRRTDQSRSVDVVSRAYRRKTVSGRRHVVADGNRRHHDLAASRHHLDAARKRDATSSRNRRRHRERRRRVGPAGRRRIHRAHASLAGHAARHLGRRRTLQANLLVEIRAPLSCRRRLPPRHGRQLLVHGPHRRRDER